MFGTLQSNIVRGGSDLAGWVRGKMAADQAHLNFGHLDGAARPDSAPDQPVPALGV